MKAFKQFVFILLLSSIIISLHGCNNGKTNQNETAKIDSSITDTQSVNSKTLISTSSNSDGAGETISTPVYAIWVSKKEGNRTYDGLYDSTSNYIRLCESKKIYHIDDRSEVSINANDYCFHQGSALKMIIIKKDSAAPLFLTVLHVDSVGKNLVGLTDNNDTIATSANAMNYEAFEKLKIEYRATPFKEAEVKKMKQYYLPEAKIQNLKKKEQIIKMNSEIKTYNHI